jgi:hypothetical protein
MGTGTYIPQGWYYEIVISGDYTIINYRGKCCSTQFAQIPNKPFNNR